MVNEEKSFTFPDLGPTSALGYFNSTAILFFESQISKYIVLSSYRIGYSSRTWESGITL